jgi:RES domain-containing protein
MPISRRDERLIEALDALLPAAFSGTVWRVVRDGLDPRQCSASGGRWDDGTFDVLYTSQARDGAIAEMYFHLKRGQPVFPRKARFRLHELRLSAEPALDVSDPDTLAGLGVDMSRYGQLSYEGRVSEYPRTQAIGEVAHMLDYAALLAPNARWDGTNVVAFCDRIAPEQLEVVSDHGLIDWSAWYAENRGKVSF